MCIPSFLFSNFEWQEGLWESLMLYTDLFWMHDSTFEAEFADVIPVVKSSIAGTRVIGRMCVGE
jgi:hypothetical protein